MRCLQARAGVKNGGGTNKERTRKPLAVAKAMDNDSRENKSNDGAKDCEMRKIIRIFVSSPGDVGAERVIADRVIRRLQREYRNIIDIEPILWENLPLTPTTTFQDGIDELLRSAPIDVAIFLLGARLGSSPGRNYIRADGKPYGSGTEYEFDMMMEAYHRSGRPLILFYKKEIQERQVLSGKDFSEAEDIIQQFKAVNQFVEEHFYDKDKGAYIAYHLLDDKSIGFEQRLETHLREIMEKLLPVQGTPRWSGNPYKGLLSFGIEDEAIFFGRSTVLNELERELFARCSTDEQMLPSVIVSGESGAGKSSFVKAGLLPDLIRTTLFPKSRVEYRIVTPGQFGNQPCEGLWQILREILPGLPDMPHLSVSDMQLEETITTSLKKTIQKRTCETGSRPVPLLVVDQLEEIFTHADVAESERTGFAKLLYALQKSDSVLLVFTIRSDFYQNLTSGGEWLAIKKDALLCDLPRMTVDEYRQVITAPAELAGYKWERDERGGRRLDEVILDDAVKQQVPLPLLEFTLSDIVERSSDGGPLSFSAYKAIGGIGGAIQKRADEFFASLSSDEKAAFYRLLGSLITVNPADGKYVRSEIPVKTVESDKTMRKVLDVFVSNRLFSVSGNETKEAAVTIAHEALISQWKVIQDWIEREHQLIQAKRECEAAMVKWESNNCARELLLSSSSDLAQAEDLLLCWGALLTDRLIKFIKLSFKRKYRCRAWWTLIASILLAMIVGLALLIAFVFALNSQRYLLPLKDGGDMPGASCFFLPLFGMALLGTSWIALVYSATQRFRGCPKLLRGYKDLAFYGLGLLLSVVGGSVNLWVASVLNTYYDIKMSAWQNCPNILPGLIFLTVFTKSISNAWYAKHRRAGSLAFGYRSGAFSRILLSLRRLFLVLFVCYTSYIIFRTLKSAYVHRERYDDLAEHFFMTDPSIEKCDWLVKELEAQRDEYTSAFPSTNETILYCALQIVRGHQEDVLNDKWSIWQLQVEDANKAAQVITACHIAAGDIDAAYEVIRDSDLIDAYKKMRYALILNKTGEAQMHFKKLECPVENPLSDKSLDYAHGLLLCSNDVASAEALYNGVMADKALRRKMIGDFAIFKRFDEYRKKIEDVVRNLNLEVVPVIEGDEVDVAKEFPWLNGVWQWQRNDDMRVDMTIDLSRRLNCKCDDYDLAKKKISERRLYRMRIKSENDVWKVELYNTLKGYFMIGTMRKIDDCTIEITILYSGDDSEKGQKRIYKKRVTSNGTGDVV